MALKHGGGAVCDTRHLAMEYSQAQHLTELGVSNICVDRSPGSRISRVLGWQDGIWKMSFRPLEKAAEQHELLLFNTYRLIVKGPAAPLIIAGPRGEGQ